MKRILKFSVTASVSPMRKLCKTTPNSSMAMPTSWAEARAGVVVVWWEACSRSRVGVEIDFSCSRSVTVPLKTWVAVGGLLRCRHGHYFSHRAMLCWASWGRFWQVFIVVVRGTKGVESVEEQERVLPRVSIKSWISDLGPQLSDLIRPIRGANHEASINEVVHTRLMSPSCQRR